MEFILLGLTDSPVLERLLFGASLVVYLIILVGNQFKTTVISFHMTTVTIFYGTRFACI
jgi:olfactory receptor